LALFDNNNINNTKFIKHYNAVRTKAAAEAIMMSELMSDDDDKH